MFRRELLTLFATAVLVSIPSAAVAQTGWHGFYLGGAIDFGAGNADTTFTALPDSIVFPMATTTMPMSVNGASGWVFAGVNLGHGKPNCVYGFEGGVGFARPDGWAIKSPILDTQGAPFASSQFASGQYSNVLVTATARAGLIVGPTLIYGFGGLATARVEYLADADFGPLSFRSNYATTRVGYTYGGGLEYQWTNRLGFRSEFYVVNLGDETNVADSSIATPFQMEHTWNTRSIGGRVGLSLRF